MATRYASQGRHILHCIFYFTLILVYQLRQNGGGNSEFHMDPILEYGYFGTGVLYLLRFLNVLALPQAIFNFLGLIVYNSFPDKVTLKSSPISAPFICIRIVTRGSYPQLVIDNVKRNINLCLDVGLENFVIEVVTDKAIGLPKQTKVIETVVPKSYKPKSGAMFKARALQYCLEDGVNTLQDNDWIVHLDEETLMTENSIRGILNFVCDGRCQFGQGMITYANERVENWLTTLIDSSRVAEDYGKLRFQFHTFHRPVFSWKGSYVVSQAGAERKVTYDHGPEGSVAEDCFFAMIAYRDGYLFNFIEGEMWEKSAFTIWDFIQQRKRWLQGVLLVAHSPKIPLANKFFVKTSIYSWSLAPVMIIFGYLAQYFPVPDILLLNILCTFITAVSIYQYIFGVIKSFSISRLGAFRYCMLVLGSTYAMSLSGFFEIVAVSWGLIGAKYHFYIVNKEIKSTVTV